MEKSFDYFLSHGSFTAIEFHPEMIANDELSDERLVSVVFEKRKRLCIFWIK